MRNLICCTMLAILFTGCVSSGTKIDQSKISQIRPGETTRDEVIKLMGKPTLSQSKTDGSSSVIYQHMVATAKPEGFIPIAGMFLGGANSTIEQVTISFTNNIVSDISNAHGEDDFKTGLGANTSTDQPKPKKGK